MASNPIIYPPPAWTSRDIVLYHGTLNLHAAATATGTIRVSLGKPHTDFGPGFYTTTLLRQARTWAAQNAALHPGTSAAVIEIVIPRNHLAHLETLAFVRGDFHADDYWSLIHYCRKGAQDHGRTGQNKHYDVV